MRWTAIVVLAAVFAVSVWFLVATIPSAKRHEAFVFHYNIYLGIDDVRSWYWAFALPLSWLAFTVFELVSAFGTYRGDPYLARALMVLATAGLFPFSVILFYLSLANV